MDQKNNHTNPPQWPLKLLHFLIKDEYVEEIEGDISERYREHLSLYSVKKANRIYALDSLSLIRPKLMKKIGGPHKSNHFSMFKYNLLIAVRNIKRQRSFAAINISGLTLGFTCAILIFILVKYHLSFDTFHPNLESIYRVTTEFHQEEISKEPNVPQPIGNALREDYDFAQKIAMVYSNSDWLVSIASSQGEKKFRENIAFAEHSFFNIFNFPLIKGEKSTQLIEPNTALVTERFAKKLFGDEDPINQVIRVQNKIDFRITGILKNFPENTDRKDEIYLSYTNLKDYNEWLAGNSWQGLAGGMNCFIVAKQGIASADINKVFPGLSRKYYNERDAEIYQFKLQHISDIHFNPDLGGSIAKNNLLVLSLIGLFLIITACVNFVNLATAQALQRSKEIGIRKVLGSNKVQLFRQFITETGLITIFALALAFIIADLALPFLNVLLDSRLQIDFIQDKYLLIFIPVLLLIVILLSGTYPGLIMAGYKPVQALKSKLSQKHAGGLSIRRGLVVSQFVISQLLIICTIVIAFQMHYTRQVDMGFNKDAIVILPIPDREKAKVNAFHTNISRFPGVEKVSFCSRAPASNAWASVTVHYSSRIESEDFDISVKAADDQYVSTFDLQLVAGRNLQPSDTVREFLINETAVKRFGEDSPQDVIGKKMRIGLNNSEGIIIGVVKDFHNRSLHESIAPLCITSSVDWYSNCAVRVTPANLQSTISNLESSWKDVFPNHLFDYSFLDNDIAEFYVTDQMVFRLIQIFALIAIFISCLGIYGLVSFMATQKVKEIGVRKVLGANLISILWLFGKEFTYLLLIAFVMAAPIAWWVMQNWLESFTYRVGIGVEIFVLSLVVTFMIALITVGNKSLKASLANPVDSIRNN